MVFVFSPYKQDSGYSKEVHNMYKIKLYISYVAKMKKIISTGSQKKVNIIP